MIEQGAIAFIYRSVAFAKYVIESKYYGRAAKWDAPLNYRNVILPVDMEIFDNRIRHAFVAKSYEAAEVELIDEYVAGQYDIIDLGSSTGFTTTYALKQLNERRCGVAVEANPEMIKVIETVREMNSIDFDIEHAAYCPGQSEVTFYVHSKTVSSSTKRRGEREVAVPAVSIADILTKYDVGEFVCLVDIEGGEIDLVQNELALLEHRCKLIIIELHKIDGIAGKAKQRLSDSEFDLVDSIGDVYVYRNNSI